MRRTVLAAAVLAAATRIAPAQSLAERVRAADGAVQVVYPTRPGVCGDSRGMIGGVFDQSIYDQGDNSANRRGGWQDRLCVRGPARVVATVVDHQIVALRVSVGPMLTAASSGFNVSARDAAAWLGALVEREDSRVANDAMLPLMIADETEPWAMLLRVARNENRPMAVRRNSMLWLATGVNVKLGLNRGGPLTDDDEIRKQAVFALSQQPKSESVPALIDIARSSKSPVARREAIFWLGQTGDRRAAELYAELLKLP